MKGLLGMLVLVAGCGSEIGRIPFRDAGAGSATVALGASRSIQLWTQLDVVFSGQLFARYAVSLVDPSGATVSSVTCNPLDVSVLESSFVSNVSDPKTYRYQGEMNGCSLASTGAGRYTVQALLTVDGRPPDLVINDLSLVIKD